MGTFADKNCILYCGRTKNKIENRDIYLDTQNTLNKVSKIILIQSKIRGYLLRKELFNFKQIKEVSIDYNTDGFENNQMILKLNNLIPKLELTDKEEYEINNSNNKIIAILYADKSVYKGMINEKGEREGFRKFFLSDVSIYKGSFYNNKMEGRGRLININGFVYEGEFKNGKSNGYG